MRMIARMRFSPRRRPTLFASLLLLSVTGCHGLGKKHEADRVPQFGTIDANQPGELRKVSQSAYIIEPPDELEISAQPSVPELGQATFIVQADGNVDLGFAGDAYLSGLTLEEAEERIAIQLN